MARALFDRLGSDMAARWLESIFAVILLIAGGCTIVLFLGQSGTDRPLSPLLSALLMMVNLVPAIALIMLWGRRLAVKRAALSGIGSKGRLHVRLVAMFSFIAAAPMLIVVVFASVLFQSGVQFWFSDTARGMLENAGSLARGYYDEKLRDVGDETITMAGDIRNYLGQASIDDPRFGQAYFLQVFNRKLSASAIVEIGPDGVQRTAAVVAPQEGGAAPAIPAQTIAALKGGKAIIVTASPEQISATLRLYEDREVYLYAARDFNVPSFQLGTRAQTVLDDYQAMIARSRQLQLQFNLILFLAALFITALAVWIALIVADRLVRPVTILVHAAQKVAEGNLATRVGEIARHQDEVGILTRSFNRMTERLEEQTGDLVKANNQLETRRSFIETVLGSVSAGVLSLDAAGRITLANSMAERILGGGAQLVDRSLVSVSPALTDLAQSGNRTGIVHFTGAGGPRTLAVTIEPGGAGNVMTFEDITEQLVDQRRAAWADVARRIAHEIKNPLTPIQLAAERLKRRFGAFDGKDGEIADQLTRTIIRQVGDLRKIVDEFSSFARMPSPIFREESFSDILRHAIFLQEVANPAISFTLEAEDPMLGLWCDRRQMGQAITNILKNAVEAITARAAQDKEFAIGDGRVTVIAGRIDHEIVITLSDNGAGLPADRERLIEPYVTTRESGTGLGLAIVRKIVDDHFGKMVFEDAHPSGTRVVLSFSPERLAREEQGSETIREHSE